jgi:hypothetical protein
MEDFLFLGSDYKDLLGLKLDGVALRIASDVGEE